MLTDQLSMGIAIRMSALAAHGPRQRGQALVFVTVTLLLMVIVMMTTYNIGQLTNQKTRLQNTADAAAYSAAVAQARDYNFSAYMNRAMIANDVAVAQLVALRSWTENYNETFKSGGLTAQTKPGGGGVASWVQTGPMYPMWSIPEGIFKAAAGALRSAFASGASVMVPLLQGMNTGFAGAQKVYHYSTALTVAQILGVDGQFNAYMRSAVGFDLSGLTGLIQFADSYNVVKMNDGQAALSLLGFAAYARDTSQWLTFTADRNPIGPWGRDTSDWTWNYTQEECHGHYIYNPFGSDWCWRGGNSHGGWTNVTYHVPDIRTRDYPDDGTFDGPQKDRYANVVIASLDEFTTDRNKAWNLPFLVDPVLLIGPAARPTSWFLKMLFHDSEGVELWNDDREVNDNRIDLGPFGMFYTSGGPLSNPQNGFRKDPGSWNNRWKAHDETSFLGLATIPICGIPFWGCINIPAMPYKSGWQFDKAEADVSTGNPGGHPIHISRNEIFRKYRDVKNINQGTNTANQNWSSPPLLVEIERASGSIPTTEVGARGCGSGLVKGSPVSAVFSPGNFRMGDGSSANCMRAMATAQAYFSRPTDLWPRADNKVEYGSLYSPYWQARLVQTSVADQMLSQLMHAP